MHASPAPQSADTTAVILKHVEVSSRKAPKSALSTAPLRAMDAADMVRSGVTSVAEAIHRMPGVTLRDYGGAGGLKTVSVRGFGAGHTGVIYDGVPLGDAQSGQIDLSRYSTNNLSAVSMVIGDNDDIFIPARAAVSAATFTIATEPATRKPVLESRLRYGAWQYINCYLKAGTPVSETLCLNFTGEYTHADNDYPFKLKNVTIVSDERRNNSRMNSGHAEFNALWTPDDRTSVSAKVYGYDNGRHLPGPVIYYNNVCNERLHEQNAFAQAQVRRYFSDKLWLKAIAKFNYASSKYSDKNGIYPGGILRQYYWQREYYTSASLLYMPDKRLMLNYAADYFYNNLNSNLPNDKRPRRHSILQSATAKYHSERFTAMARLIASIYDNGANSGRPARNVSKLSPSLSMSVQPWTEHLLFLRAHYKNIFRAPTFNESYFDHYGSEELLPESTDQVNIGATYTVRPSGCLASATFTLDAYYNHVNDMIVAVPYNMFVWRMVNLSKVRTIGVDAAATATVQVAAGHSLTFSANYSFQRAEPRTSRQSSEWGKQVAYMPKHSGNASMAYENPWCSVSVHATGVSERYTTNNNLPDTRIDGYIECGITAWHSFSIQNHELELRADIQNLLNKQYEVVARYPMPGRNWQISVSYKL